MQNSKTKEGHRVFIWMGSFAPLGGIETFVADLSQAAIKSGFQVDLLAWDRRSEFLPRLRAAGVRLFVSPWRWACRWAIPDWLILPLGILLCHKADVVVFPKMLARPMMHRLVNRYRKWTGNKPRFVYVTPYRPSELFDTATEAGKRATRDMLASVDLIICQNAVFGDDLRALGYEGRLEISPYLPPHGAENPAPYAKDAVTLGFLGRLEHQKNLPELLKVFALLREKAPGMRLRLIGDGSLKEELFALAQQLGIAPYVEFYGSVPRDRISAAIRSCQLFCFTSHSEGQPIAALEILSEGRPIIATNVGAFPVMLADPALGEVVRLGDTPAFLDAVNRMLTRQKAGVISPAETVRAYRAKFNREAVLRKYMEALSPEGPLPEGGADRNTRDVNLSPTAYREIADRVPAPLPISVMITTKNRLDELRRTCRQLQRLDPAPLEILITADGCTDGTIDFVRSEMPSARLIINETGRGSIASRDHMIRAAQGDLVLSLDDDSYPQEHDCVATIAALFAQRQQMAVLHFPQCTDEYPETLPTFDFGAARVTRSYASSGAVLRRETYLQLPGFEPSFFHAYEEPDYALQCVAAGHDVFYDPSVSIRHHYTSALRNECRTHHRHARNEFWSTLLRCPFPHLFLVAAYRVLSQLRYAFSREPGWVIREPVWWFQALGGIPRNLTRRQPVAWADYRRWLAMPEIAYPPPPAPSMQSPAAAAKPRTA